MSVKVKLNNKSLFTSPFVIGSRLYEGEAAQQAPAADNNTAGQQ